MVYPMPGYTFSMAVTVMHTACDIMGSALIHSHTIAELHIEDNN